MLRNAGGGGGVKYSGKKRYQGSTLLALRGGAGPISRKKCYVTLEWPLKRGYLLYLCYVLVFVSTKEHYSSSSRQAHQAPDEARGEQTEEDRP